MIKLAIKTVACIAISTLFSSVLAASVLLMSYSLISEDFLFLLFNEAYLSAFLNVLGLGAWIVLCAKLIAEGSCDTEHRVHAFKAALVRRSARKRISKLLATPIRNDVDAARAFGLDVVDEPFPLVHESARKVKDTPSDTQRSAVAADRSGVIVLRQVSITNSLPNRSNTFRK